MGCGLQSITNVKQCIMSIDSPRLHDNIPLSGGYFIYCFFPLLHDTIILYEPIKRGAFMDKLCSNDEVYLRIEGKSYKPYICFLVIFLSTMVQILSSSVSEGTGIIVTLYLNIVLILIAIYYIQFYGVVAAALSSLIFSFTVGQSWENTCINVFANFIQAVLLYAFCAYFKKHRSMRKSEKVLNIYKICLFILGFAYFLLNISGNDNFVLTSLVIFALLLLTHIYKAIVSRNICHIVSVLLLLIPSLIGASIGSLQITDGAMDLTSYLDNFPVWVLSNSILILSFGYLLVCCLNPNTENKLPFLTVKLSTVLFYTSTLAWNTIIYMVYIMGWLDKSTASYVFPWAVGTLFFLMNMYYSTYDEVDHQENKFEWFEKRAVVAENNTQMLVAIISFLLPICAQLLGAITISISLLFILNITAAIISIGLIWVPQGMIKHMAVIKHIKTVFHLFTLSLLLLNIVLMINESVTGAV